MCEAKHLLSRNVSTVTLISLYKTFYLVKQYDIINSNVFALSICTGGKPRNYHEIVLT